MDKGQGVEKVLQSCSPQVRELAEALRTLIRQAAPEAPERGYTGWGAIGYDKSGTACAIHPQRSWVNLAFSHGVELPDPEGLLEGTGKSMRHIKVRRLADIRPAAFTPLIQEALKRAGV